MTLTETGLSLDEIGERVTREHREVARAVASALEHALACGDALLQARQIVPQGEWSVWLEERAVPHATGALYMRLATYRDLLPDGVGVEQARIYLRGLPGLGSPNLTEDDDREIKRLAKRGVSTRQIAELFDVSQSAIVRRLGRSKEAQRRANTTRARQARRAREALRRQERDRAMKALGGSVAEVYSMIRKTAQAIDRAHDANDDPGVRRLLSFALRDVHAAEEKIVRAVGVS